MSNDRDGAVLRRRRTERFAGGRGDFDKRERRKQIEIHDVRAWYNSDGIINGEEIVAGLLASEEQARAVWAKKLIEKKPFNLVAVAIANKMARIAFAILRGKTSYREISA
jgi:hypothetical protein